MANILQTTICNAFLWIKILNEISLKSDDGLRFIFLILLVFNVIWLRAADVKQIPEILKLKM